MTILYSTQKHKEERAILVGVVLRGMTRAQEQDSLEELAQLTDTAGAVVVDTVLQDRSDINPATLIGKGMVHQIARRVNDLSANLVVFDIDLTPVQMKNLEKQINRKIVDRSGLILDIFARRARTREAQIQVELAQLQYYLPRLTRQWTHLSRQEAGIGTRGPGETQLEVDRRAIRKRIGHLKNDLGKIERQRSIRRKRRKQNTTAALVGYTNVGKSSLLNTMADSEVFVEDRLFATLDTTIRALTLLDQHKVLLIDTVGFIRKLPPHLVASFRSTLEETVEADILFHVVDVSHPRFEEQIGSVLEILQNMKIDTKPMITVLNKIDRLKDRDRLLDYKQRFQGAVFTSAIKGMGLNDLRRQMGNIIREQEVEEVIRIPIHKTKQIAWLYQRATVLDKRFSNGFAVIRYRAQPEQVNEINQWMEKSDDNAHSRRG